MNYIKNITKDLIYLILFCIFLYFNFQIANELDNSGLKITNLLLSICFSLGAVYNSLITLWEVIYITREPVVRIENYIEILEGVNNYLDKVKNFVQFKITKLKWKIVKENQNEN